MCTFLSQLLISHKYTLHPKSEHHRNVTTNPLSSVSWPYTITSVMHLNISVPLLPTSWPPVWHGGHNPFTPELGKYFLPDLTEHTELNFSCWVRRGVRNKLDKRRIKGNYRLTGFMCAGGKGGLFMSINLNGRVSVGPACFNYNFWPEGERDQHSELWQDTHHMCNLGEWREEIGVGWGPLGGGYLRLFKQISEEYQSLKTLQEMPLVCSPAAEAFVSPLRDHFVIW